MNLLKISKKRIIDILSDYDLDISTASGEFDEFIERRRQAIFKKLTAKHTQGLY
jgi:hypothetical protein